MRAPYLKYILALFGLTFSFFALPLTSVQAQGTMQITLYLFWGDGCPHCSAEKAYLKDYLSANSDVTLVDYEIWYNTANQQKLKEVGERLHTEINGVPFTLIGDKYSSGFSEASTPKFISQAVEYYRQNPQPDIVLNQPAPTPIQPGDSVITTQPESTATPSSDNVHLPVFGEVNPRSVPLPLLAVVIGTIDGFNPCSLWVLIFLISLLIGLDDRRKVFLYGGTFILVEALSYAAFMTAWLSLMLFIGYISWIRIGLGIFALLGGLYSLRSYFKSRKRNGGCDLVDEKKRERTLQRVKGITTQKTLWLALAGIAALAFSVNLIELLCSAGLPATFTQVLGLNHLIHWHYVGYIALYILFFMVDDLIVFVGALVTMKLTGISTKYSAYSHLIGGVIMAVIGILLVFKPSLLFFG